MRSRGHFDMDLISMVIPQKVARLHAVVTDMLPCKMVLGAVVKMIWDMQLNTDTRTPLAGIMEGPGVIIYTTLLVRVHQI